LAKLLSNRNIHCKKLA